MPAKDKYSDPKLRDEIKEEVKQGDKGGAPGQWSARKAQFMAAEYKKRGGTYNTEPSEKEESQKNLSKWNEEDWQTKEGSGNAKQEDGTQKRYLPRKAWDEMDDKEKEATDKKKLDESKKGKQFVGNTPKAKNARKKASKKDDEDEVDVEKEESDKASKDDEEQDEDKGEGEEEQDKEGEDEEEEEKAQPGKKRGRPSKASSTANKKQKSNGTDEKASSNKKSGKTVGSRHDAAEPPAKQASASRLPKKGQTVKWKAMPGFVSGSVVEIVKTNKTVEGKQIKASKDDPRIVLRSDGPSKKIAVHKAEAIYFD